jgi:C-terminal processing protease CtpA/Prc
MLNSKFALRSLLGLTALSLLNCAPQFQEKYKSYSEFSSDLIMQATPTCGDDCTELKKEFKYAVYVSEQIYCYKDDKEAEYKMTFKARAQEIEDQITDNTSDTQYFLLLTKWASSFHDGHVNAMLRDDRSKLEFYNASVRFEMLAPGSDHEQLIISQVGSSVSNLKVGTVVTKIQDKDWKTYTADFEKFASGSTARMRHSNPNNIMRVLLEQNGPVPVKIEGTFAGKPVSETINRNISLYDGASDPPEPEETGKNLITATILPGNIGYLRIDGFSGSQMRALLGQAMDRLANTDGLIIDVRKNGGGDLSGDAILARLSDKKLVRFQQKVISSDYLTAARPSNLFDYTFNGGRFSDMIDRTVRSAGPDKQYKKRVVVATSSYCFSACDTFVSALKENKLATVVGEGTGGGSGNPLVFELPVSGHSMRYSVARGYTAINHSLIEGTGTLPDVVIEPTVEERAINQDLQLKKILNYIISVNTAETPGEKAAMSQPANIAMTFNLPSEFLNVTPPLLTGKPFEIEDDERIRKSKD